MTIDGMALIVVDAAGRLSELHGRAEPAPTAEAQQPADHWNALFAAAGLADRELPAGRHPTSCRRAFADERRAWEGPLPDRPEHTVRVEAACARRHVRSSLASRDRGADPARASSPPASLFNRVIGGLAAIMMPALMILGAVLARINLKAGRGDRDGAFRVGAFVFARQPALVDARHSALRRSFGIEDQRIFAGDRQRALRCRLAVAHLPRARTLHAPLLARQHPRLDARSWPASGATRVSAST